MDQCGAIEKKHMGFLLIFKEIKEVFMCLAQNSFVQAVVEVCVFTSVGQYPA